MKIKNAENNVKNNINGSTRASTSTIKSNRVCVGVDALVGPLKNKKGITLIALIITIVLMLILAGVVISLTLRRKWNI